MLKILMHKTIVNKRVLKVDREDAQDLLDFIEVGMQEELQDIVCEHNEVVDLDYLNWLLLYYSKEKVKKQMELNKDKNKEKEKYLRHIKRSIKFTEEEIKKIEKCIKKIEDVFVYFCKQDLNAEEIDYTTADTESISKTINCLDNYNCNYNLCNAYKEESVNIIKC